MDEEIRKTQKEPHKGHDTKGGKGRKTGKTKHKRNGRVSEIRGLQPTQTLPTDKKYFSKNQTAAKSPHPAPLSPGFQKQMGSYLTWSHGVVVVVVVVVLINQVRSLILSF